MIYDVNSPLFRSFLCQKGGYSDKRKGRNYDLQHQLAALQVLPQIEGRLFDKRKTEGHKPKDQKPKANENKPVMTE